MTADVVPKQLTLVWLTFGLGGWLRPIAPILDVVPPAQAGTDI